MVGWVGVLCLQWAGRSGGRIERGSEGGAHPSADQHVQRLKQKERGPGNLSQVGDTEQ